MLTIVKFFHKYGTHCDGRDRRFSSSWRLPSPWYEYFWCAEPTKRCLISLVSIAGNIVPASTMHVYSQVWQLHNKRKTSQPEAHLISITTYEQMKKRTKNQRIIIGSDRRPKTKQGIEGKIDRFRSGRIRVRVRYNWSPIWTRSPIWTYQFWRLLNSYRRSEPNTVQNQNQLWSQQPGGYV